ncbi:Centromere/kinetochore Zw10-domain-containing protein [Gaertneriomyces semiglobifer]|nr:Centromere/kinetochore Zw10-domain-containing protein [Gaertneriomyces semiglobifer]
MLHKHVLLPVAKLERVVASRQHENGVSDLELALASGRPSSNELDDVLESLSVILTFLAETVVPSIPIFHVLGSISYPQIAELVISQYLEKLIPDDLDGLKEFEIVAAKCRDFEARLADMGTVFNGDRPLSRYVEHAPLHFIIKKHHKLVSQARDILFRKGVDTLQVDERPSRHLQDALQEQVTALCRAAQVEPISLPVLDLPPNLFHFPKCTISSKARDLTKLLEGILADVTSLNTSAAKHLYKTLHTILELALALLPPPEPYAIPHLAMVLYNDCMWIMHQCIILHAKERETGLVRFVPEFRNLACKIWGQQMTSQCQQLSIHIRSSNGFDCHLPGRLPIVQKALKRAELLITQLAKVWKDTLPRHVYCQTLGDLLSHTITAICGEVLALEDIAEQESVALWNMLGEFAKIVDVTFTFETKAVDQASAQSETPPEQLANIYVRNLKRFSLITEILNMPLVKIHQNFQAHVYDGALERHELRRLVMALFAETDTRRGVLRDLETS